MSFELVYLEARSFFLIRKCSYSANRFRISPPLNVSESLVLAKKAAQDLDKNAHFVDVCRPFYEDSAVQAAKVLIEHLKGTGVVTSSPTLAKLGYTEVCLPACPELSYVLTACSKYFDLVVKAKELSNDKG